MRLVQISAGRGPLECSWIVGKVMKVMEKEARTAGLSFSSIETEADCKKSCYKSVVIGLEGSEIESFVAKWVGTIQWTVQSPFRPTHKRKNWFVSVELLPECSSEAIDLKAIRFDTMRSGGAGGQHVNKTESAVRVTHISTGITVTVSAERSQHRNKALALQLLEAKLHQKEQQQKALRDKAQWQNHNELVRGNPVRVFRGS